MKHNAEIILRSLLAGYEITKEDEVFVLSEDYKLCVVRNKYSNGKFGEEVLLVCFCVNDISEFIKWAETFTLEEVTIISANITLNEANNDR